MSSIFGGSKQKSSASNQAYGTLNENFSPLFGQAQEGANSLQQLLGGDSTGFDAYRKAVGFDAAAEQGSRGITGNAAARGLLRSGSTSKGLQAYGDSLTQQYAGNYMDRLLGQAGIGLSAGQLVGSAGNTSTQSSKSKPGIGGFLGSVASGVAASDRRLKKDIVQVGELEDGLGIYQYFYINGDGPHIGVMADEVEKLRPEALGPEVGGYMTVDYDKIEGVRN